MKPTERYSKIRGFNYTPPYAYVLNDVMDHFSEKVFEKNFSEAEKIGANSLRIFVTAESFFRSETRFLKNFGKILALAEKHRLTVMPVLFNRWTDFEYPVGSLDLSNVLYPNLADSMVRYVQTFRKSFRGDERIEMWDLCNEPFFPVAGDAPELWKAVRERENRFWERIIEAANQVDDSLPLTMGFCGAPENTPEEIFGLVDVIGMHPYSDYDGAGYEKLVCQFEQLAERLGKPLLCTETCQGSLVDDVRSECIQKSLQILTEHRCGWYAWTLCEGNMTSARPDRTDLNAKPGDRGYFSFLKRDGSFRPGHEVVLQFTRPQDEKASI